MLIDINFQSLAQNVKYKTISNSLRKRKTNSHSTSHHRVARADVGHHETAHNGATHARAANFAKTPPRYRQINLGSTALFLEREAMQKGPRNYPLLPRPGPWSPLRAPARRARQWTATPAN